MIQVSSQTAVRCQAFSKREVKDSPFHLKVMLSGLQGRTSCPCASQAVDAFEMGKQTSVSKLKKNVGDFKPSPSSKQFLSVSSIQTILSSL